MQERFSVPFLFYINGDKMKFYSLCSSSKGNCTYVGSLTYGILIDAGFGVRNIKESLDLVGISMKAVQAVFVTHEHMDHIGGLRRFLQARRVPVYGTRGTLGQLLDKGVVNEQDTLYEINQHTAIIGDLEISPFHTPHDCADSLGFLISDGKNTIGLCTDLGTMPKQVFHQLCKCDFLLLESNYDPALLDVSQYPYYLKKRITSDYGHLSNQEAAKQIKKLVEHGVTHFLLGHLSQQTNLPALALQNVQTTLGEAGMENERDYWIAAAEARNNGIIYEI